MTKQTSRLQMHSLLEVHRTAFHLRFHQTQWVIANDVDVGVVVATEHRNSPKKPKQTNQTVATAVQTHAASPKQPA